MTYMNYWNFASYFLMQEMLLFCLIGKGNKCLTNNLCIFFIGVSQMTLNNLRLFALPELSSDGLPLGYLHHSHVGSEACLDDSFWGDLIFQVWRLSLVQFKALISFSSSFPPQVSQSTGGSVFRYVVLIAARLTLLTMCGWVICWTLVNLCKNHSVLNLLFLGYPWVWTVTLWRSNLNEWIWTSTWSMV